MRRRVLRAPLRAQGDERRPGHADDGARYLRRVPATLGAPPRPHDQQRVAVEQVRPGLVGAALRDLARAVGVPASARHATISQDADHVPDALRWLLHRVMVARDGDRAFTLTAPGGEIFVAFPLSEGAGKAPRA